MQSAIAFLLGISLLVTLHEAGHFAIARLFRVRVLTFSVGFGRPLLSWLDAATGTQYSLGWIPLGGYVRMLDRQEPHSGQTVSEDDVSFDQLIWWKRFLIVAAGPVANLLVAIVFFATIPWFGVELPVAKLSEPPTGSVMQLAGIKSGDWVHSVREGASDERREIHSFADLQAAVLSAWARSQNITIEVTQTEVASIGREVELPLTSLPQFDPQNPAIEQLGLIAPYSPAVIDQLVDAGAAKRAGLMSGDEVTHVNEIRVQDAQHLRALIQGAPNQVQTWQVRRQGQTLYLQLSIEESKLSGRTIGKAGIQLRQKLQTVSIEENLLDALWLGATRTYDMSKMSLAILGRMLVGEASLQHLSGPIRMAQAAGESAQTGWMSYISFLGLISASIAVLNLLPIPMLDGGHLMYYLWEGATGRPVAESLQSILHKFGLMILAAMMALALSNDFLSLFSFTG